DALPPEVGVLVPAAGRGERAGDGDPKQFRPIRGVPMLLRALRPFTSHPRVLQVVVALPQADATRPPAWLAGFVGERLRLVAGGPSRTDSVRRALAALDARCTVVLIHDAARPFVTRDTIDRVIATARAGQGALAAVAVGDTLKRVDAARRVTATVDRRDLWRAQTPQGFPRPLLEAAYQRVLSAPPNDAPPPTDDAELVERAGFPVIVVPDTPANIKVTTPEDFRLAEALAAV
ncbi:MAG TPA: 2-C-methyl-D-erythritol 4-phosphate cytidylyltransferase, partial [Gemmatimonadales bacterium]|nr:2-C-methyl-D-erythritol 4-phosphate cytidylyltransferase [Gemmatimonadales bacterium]